MRTLPRGNVPLAEALEQYGQSTCTTWRLYVHVTANDSFRKRFLAVDGARRLHGFGVGHPHAAAV